MDKQKESKYEYNKQYAKKYLTTLDEFRIRMPAGRRDVYKDAAAAVGKSLNQFILDCLDEKLKSMHADPATNEEPHLK